MQDDYEPSYKELQLRKESDSLKRKNEILMKSAQNPAYIIEEVDKYEKRIEMYKEALAKLREENKGLAEANKKITDAKLISVFIRALHNKREAITQTYMLENEDREVIAGVIKILDSVIKKTDGNNVN